MNMSSGRFLALLLVGLVVVPILAIGMAMLAAFIGVPEWLGALAGLVLYVWVMNRPGAWQTKCPFGPWR